MRKIKVEKSVNLIAVITAAAAMGAAGCGDGLLCPSTIIVDIVSPSDSDSLSALDVSDEPGIQLDVSIRSNLRSGDSVTLALLDDLGGEIATHETTTDGNGNAVFVRIDLLDQTAALRATATVAECGSGFDQLGGGQVALTFNPPITDGLLGGPDGTVSGGDLTLDICGTVAEAGADVKVSIDGGASVSASVFDNDWCVNGVVLSEGDHTVFATVAAPLRSGQISQDFEVDVTPPDAIAALTGDSPNRHTVNLDWQAPADNGVTVDGYILKVADVAFDEGNFDDTGSELASPAPSSPGSAETLVLEQLRTGTEYHFGIAAVDPAGNRTVVAAVGPIVPDFDVSAITRGADPGVNDDNLGFQMAQGDYNGDNFSDIAISAPFRGDAATAGLGAVYVYFGGPNGVEAPILPDVTINGVEFSHFGQGLTAVDWDGNSADDLAVSAPFADGTNGRAYIFLGGSSLTGVLDANDADVVIGVNTGDPTNWLNGSFMGWSMIAARFDDDANDDLIISAAVGGGNGGVVVVYGGSGETSILLSTEDSAQSGTARARVIQDPDTAAPAFGCGIFGDRLFNLGRTAGTGDNTDDVGVSYYDSNAALVIRGRQQPAVPGTTLEDFEPLSDLTIRHRATTCDGTEKFFFGSSMGSIADLNGDGERDIVIGSWGEDVFADRDGRVYIVDGQATGTEDVANAITTIESEQGARKFGSAIVNNALARLSPDVNGDGVEDLVIAGGTVDCCGQQVTMFVWFGGTIPTGVVTPSSADHTIAAPPPFVAPIPPNGGAATPMTAIWAGDLNNDGLEDVCWADAITADRDGAFQILSDD